MIILKKRNIDLTQGTIWKQVLIFAIPLFFSSLIQQLYNTVDLIFVGHFLNKEASVAVGSGSLLTACVINFFVGLSVGVSVIAGQSYGGKDYQKLKKTISNAMIISFVGGIFLVVVGVIGSTTFLRWLNTPEEVMELSTVYLRIYFLSIFSIIFFNVSSGILRATGDSTTPTTYQLLGGICNVIADYIFVVPLNMGVEGVAIATLLSQTVASILTVRKLTDLPDKYKLVLKDIRYDSDLVLDIIKIGVPSGIQGMIITLSNLIIQANINTLDISSIAAFIAYYKVEIFVYMPILAFGQACMTFVSQNVGADKYHRARKGMWVCILIGNVVCIATTIILLSIPDAAFFIFTKDVSVINIGIAIVKRTFPFYFIYVFLECFSCAIRATGRSFATMVITIVNMCILRILLIEIIMNYSAKAQDVAMIYPITWITSAICMFAYLQISGALSEKYEKI